MRLPKLSYTSNLRKTTQITFGGMQQTLGARDGSIWNMKNMTSDNYPLLSTRKPRARLERPVMLDAPEGTEGKMEPGGIFAHGKLCWVYGGMFFYGGEYKFRLSHGRKTFAAMGSKVVILPDKRYYDTKTDESGYLGDIVGFTKLRFRNGKMYGEDANANGITGDGADFSHYFKVGDAVTISGCTIVPENNKTLVIRGFSDSGKSMWFYENSFTLVNGEEYEETGELSIEREIPELLFGMENENRLWGCTEDTICASKLGDITNWNVFDQLASDSWQVTPSSPGRFVGGISYRGYPVVFKEDKVYKVYGSMPSNFELVGGATLGLEEGSANSLAVAGETLFYLSRTGIVGYTGGVPQPVSTAALGQKKFRNAVAGSDGLKYYVSMQDEEGVWGLYVYDTQKRLWHKEDTVRVTHFAFLDGNLYGMMETGEVMLMGNWSGDDLNVSEEIKIPWEVEFNDFTDNSPNKKGIGKLQIRMSLEKGAAFEIWIQYDSNGQWEKIESITGEDPKRTYQTPVVPRRCDHCRLKLTGWGGCTIYSITRETYAGSEMRSRPGRN